VRTYTVRFWDHTDLRLDWTGDATDERMALNLALARYGMEGWVNASGFRIEVALGDGQD
jgi:hypothetical protein